MYSPGIIIGYDSTHASIPAAWTRVTDYDSRFLKGTAAATNPGTNGGSSTHTHTSTAHSHTLNAHTHTFTINPWNSYNFTSSNKTSVPAEANKSVHDGHYHTGTTDGATGGTTNTTAITYGAVSNNPYYYQLILIKSTGWNFLPVNGVIFSAATSRSGLTFLSAAANRFIAGSSVGANAGAMGGSTTNVHDISHTHTTNTHTHTATSGASTFLDRHGFGASGVRIGVHTHSFTTAAAAAPIDAYSGTMTGAEVVQPAYTTLNPFKNASAVNILPRVGDIAMWDGLLSNIPVGWILCDGTNGTVDMRGRFIKVPNTAAASTTGGSNTHTHAASSHTHTSAAHNHTASNLTDYAATYNADNTGEGGDLTGGAHTVTIDNTTVAYASASTSADSANNEPPYRTIAFIQMSYYVIGGSLLMALL